ncbi:MAG TPA: hypothetical protein VFU62_14065 [Hanamia sp.]|nr:hypothetical protein [Hanamia sp.]
MPSLEEILKKTKSKVKQVSMAHKAPSIATADRPDFSESVISSPDLLEKIGNVLAISKAGGKERENLRQTQDKVETNLGQTKDKLKTTAKEIKAKHETNLRQTQDKLETQLETKTYPKNLRQTEDKLKTSKLLAKLSGLQKAILLFIYDECQAVLDSVTAPLTIEYVSHACRSPISSVRKTIQRMIGKNILIRDDHKDGRGGWTQYRLPEAIYQEINYLKSRNKLETNLRQTQDKLETQLETNALEEGEEFKLKPSSPELPEDWKKIDRTPFHEIGHLGLKELNNIYQKCSFKITPEIMQRSILHYVWAVKNNSPRIKKVKDHTAFFVNHMQIEEDGFFEAHYVSEEELERQQRRQKLLATLENQFKQPKFLEWFQQLDEKQKDDLVPSGIKSSVSYEVSNAVIQKERALTYFEQKIWPELLNQLENAF